MKWPEERQVTDAWVSTIQQEYIGLGFNHQYL